MTFPYGLPAVEDRDFGCASEASMYSPNEDLCLHSWQLVCMAQPLEINMSCTPPRATDPVFGVMNREYGTCHLSCHGRTPISHNWILIMSRIGVTFCLAY